ncbi:uncharacterized protein LOC111085900 [Limulus polyphemus]|uniref:Uncharacterized protein LOC111085900 n=1 Tax=Limulus polyphemus TaxID=6850 RepID=A0ABM1SFK5_LIMPO|nr:uncharacterized protein LOC111085900 [Limulus polyphemus]
MYEDGKVVEDSGPQITTKTTEDNHKEETENTDYKATGGDDLSLDDRGSARLVTEKIVTKHTVRENKEESKQLCDESFQDVTGTDFLNKIPDHSDGFLSQGEDLNKSLQEKIIHYF